MSVSPIEKFKKMITLLVQQRLIRVQLLAKFLSGEEIARELISVLQVHYKVLVSALIGAMHDRASVNAVAMRTVQVIYPQILDIRCFSHTVDHVGEQFVTPVLDEFVSAWALLFSHSPKSRLVWQNRVGRSVKSIVQDLLVVKVGGNQSTHGIIW